MIISGPECINIGQNAGEIRESIVNKCHKISVISSEYMDTSFCVKPPKVSQKSLDSYKNYIHLGKVGSNKVSDKSLKVYLKYIQNRDKI